MKTNKLATASLVFGLIAVIFMWVPVVGIASLVLGIASLVLSVFAKRRPEGCGFRNAGFIMGVVATTIGAVQLAVIIFFSQAISGVMDSINELGPDTNQESYSAPQYVESVEPQDAPTDLDYGTDSDFDPVMVVDDFIKDRSISRESLVFELTSAGLTEVQANEAIDTVDPNFNVEALEQAKLSLENSIVTDSESLIELLTSSGYTYDEALYASSELGLK